MAGDAAQVPPVTAVSGVLIVLGARVFLGERTHPWCKLGAALLAAAGVVLLGRRCSSAALRGATTQVTPPAADGDDVLALGGVVRGDRTSESPDMAPRTG